MTAVMGTGTVAPDTVPGRHVVRSAAMLWSSVVVAAGILAASAYGLLAAEPYRSLPEATVLAAKAQDACSIVVAVLLVWLVRRPVLAARTHLVWVGLLGYVVYSYAIYLIGVPMNRMFLVYVVVAATAGASLLGGLLRIADAPWPASASQRLRRGTGWMLVVVAALFAALWLSMLLPFALGGPPPEAEGVGGAPYPVFVLDLAVVLPAIAAVGVLLLRGRPLGAPFAVVALVKIITLFTALWAGPVTAALTGEPVQLGPDAGPSVALLLVSGWLLVSWSHALHGGAKVDEDEEHERSRS